MAYDQQEIARRQAHEAAETARRMSEQSREQARRMNEQAMATSKAAVDRANETRARSANTPRGSHGMNSAQGAPERRGSVAGAILLILILLGVVAFVASGFLGMS